MKPLRVDNHRIQIPEVQRRKVACQDLLSVRVVLALTLRIGRRGGIVEKAIQLRIGVVAAVSSVRRKACSRIRVVKDIGLLVAAYPA